MNITVAHCREVSHVALHPKLPSLLLAPEIIFIQSTFKIRGHRWGSQRRPILKLKFLRVWKLRFCHHRSIKFMQECVCFANPCINLLVRSLVNANALEFIDLLQCIATQLQYSLHCLAFLERQQFGLFIVLNSACGKKTIALLRRC